MNAGVSISAIGDKLMSMLAPKGSELKTGSQEKSLLFQSKADPIVILGKPAVFEIGKDL